MSCADTACAPPNTTPTSGSLRVAPNWPYAVWCRCKRLLEIKRQRRALRQLDDRQLADIGITRAQALRESNKLFWTSV